jgi:predicted nucleic acid-binding protein
LRRLIDELKDAFGEPGRRYSPIARLVGAERCAIHSRIRVGRLVIPKPLRDRVGLRPGEVEVTADGAGLRVEPLAEESLEERQGRLVIRARGLMTPLSGRFAMPASGSGPELLVDTSVAVTLTVADREHHAATFEALGDRGLGLAGHAAFETFSVLTRLPPPARRTPAAVARLLAAGFPHSKFLGAKAMAALLASLDTLGIAGGAVYDALVGASAKEHGLALATRDHRAIEIYRLLDVQIELVS